MNNFTTRLLTAIFFVGGMIWGIYAGKVFLYAVFLLINGMCLYEFLTITLRHDDIPLSNQIRMVLGLLFGLSVFILEFLLVLIGVDDPFVTAINGIIFYIIPLFFLVMSYEFFSSTPHLFWNTAAIAYGFFYIGLPFAFVSPLAEYGGRHTPDIVFGVIALIWCYDTGAYLAGSQFGRHLILPNISPKKTWEGAAGGTVACFGIAFLVNYVLGEIPLENWLWIAFLICIFGPLGDFIESMFKRRFDVKDTGKLLPGHGGFLDRFDSFIFVIPFVTLYLFYFGK